MGTYHVEIVGRDSHINTAKRRLSEVAQGNKNVPPAPFEYIFLAPMPADLCFKLLEVEAFIQNELSKNFGSPNHRPNWLPTSGPNVSAIQTVATDAVLCFLQNRYSGSAAALISALDDFVSLAVPFQQDPSNYQSVDDFRKAEEAREHIFVEAQKVFDINMVRALLKCLQPSLVVSGLPPCNASSTSANR